MNDFQASQDLIDHVKPTESLALVPYTDAAGYVTWGYGHKYRPGEQIPSQITEAQADSLLAGDLSIAGGAVRRLVTVEMTQRQFDGLTDFCFNLGEGALAGSSMLHSVNAGDWVTAATQCLDWDHAHVHGQLVVLAGLKVRRQWDSAHMTPAMPEMIIDNSAPVVFPPEGTPAPELVFPPMAGFPPVPPAEALAVPEAPSVP